MNMLKVNNINEMFPAFYPNYQYNASYNKIETIIGVEHIF